MGTSDALCPSVLPRSKHRNTILWLLGSGQRAFLAATGSSARPHGQADRGAFGSPFAASSAFCVHAHAHGHTGMASIALPLPPADENRLAFWLRRRAEEQASKAPASPTMRRCPCRWAVERGVACSILGYCAASPLTRSVTSPLQALGVRPLQ